MAWTIESSSLVIGNLDKLDRLQSKRILTFLYARVGKFEDPRSLGEALKDSKLGDLWKYRVGDYRVIADIQDKIFKVLIV